MARLWIGVVALLLPCVVQAEQLVYVSCTADRRVEVYGVDAQSGRLTLRSRLELSGAPGPMALSPDEQRIYVATHRRENRKRVFEVQTLVRLPNGKLRAAGAMRVDERLTYLRVAPAGDFLLTASYGAGQTSVYRLADGQRVDRERTLRTAHCVELDPSGRFAFVPHTAPNRVYQFRFDPRTGALSPNDPPFVGGPDTEHRYHQPRHLRFHPNLGLAFTSNERGGGISSWRLDPKTGTLALVQTLSALPPDFAGEGAAAEIRITPNGRFAYVSNRDKAKTPEGADSLAAFAIGPQGSLTLIGHYPTARFPRSFSVDLRGAYLYAAGQRDHHLACYRIQPNGRLKPVARVRVGNKPSWVLCVEGPKPRAPGD